MIQLSEIFQSHMTLQCDKPVKIWGTTDESQKINVIIDDVFIVNVSILKGDFVFYLPPHKPDESCTIEIKTETGSDLILEDVDFGEVWIAGGQSNMEFMICCDKESDSMMASANDPHLRFYDVGEYAFEAEKEEGLKDGSHWDRWMKFDSKDAGWFSAVGAYYALKLRQELKVPVAIVGCNWGGTTASTWLDEEILRKDKDLKIYIDDYEKVVSNQNYEKYIKRDLFFRKKQSSEKAIADSMRALKYENTKPTTLRQKLIVRLAMYLGKTGPNNPNRPGGLYKMMLSKISGFSCRGVIWYQGESDEHHADIYGKLFSSMINCWRKAWNEILPFYFVQLAPWDEWLGMNGRNYPSLRQEQQWVEDHVENTGMASIMDLGCRYDIHPKEKRPVGERLSLLALKQTYGVEKKHCYAPRIREVVRTEDKIIVKFDHAQEGLINMDTRVQLFDIVQDGKRIQYDVDMDADGVILTCKHLDSSKKVNFSFAYKDYLIMNLYNKGKLPARPYAPVEI